MFLFFYFILESYNFEFIDFGFNRFIETFTKLRNAMPAKDLMFLMQQKQKTKKKERQTNKCTYMQQKSKQQHKVQ